MTLRGFITLIAGLLALNILALMVGPWIKTAAIIAVFLAIPLLAWAYRQQMADLARELTSWGTLGREQFFLLNEEWFDRIELARLMDEPLPIVPLRGCERFEFEAGWQSVTSALAGLCFGVLVFIGIYGWGDPAGRLGSPVDIAALVLMFAGGGGFFLWYRASMTRYYEATAEALIEVAPRRRQEVLWEELESVRATMNGMKIEGPSGSIRVPSSLPKYGRLANIVVSRFQARSIRTS